METKFNIGDRVEYVGIGRGKVVNIRDDGRGVPIYTVDMGKPDQSLYVARDFELKKDEAHIVTEDNAQKIWDWLHTRGGIAVWASIDLSDLGKSWTTPVRNADGTEVTKPNWKSDSKPARIITDPADVVVSIDEEVKRFRVGVRIGAQGFSLKVTDGGSRRIRSEVAKAGEGAYYCFDYGTQEAVILKPKSITPLAQFIEQTTGV